MKWIGGFLGLAMFGMAGAANAGILQVNGGGALDNYFISTGNVVGVTPITTAAFNTATQAFLSGFDAIFIDTDFAGGPANPNLIPVLTNAQRVLISTHDPSHNTTGAQWLTQNAAVWAEAGGQTSGTTSFVLFGSNAGAWANLIATSLPAAWGLATTPHSSDSIDILAGIQGTHPIWAGPFGTVTDFPAFTATSVNWGNGHHQDLTAFNNALFAVGEVDTASGRSTSIFFDATQVPEPGTLALFGLGLAGLGFARRRKAA